MVPIKTISKSSDSIIKKIEKRLAKNSDVYIDKSITKKIDREISTLGKEKLIADHISDLAKGYGQDSKDRLLFLLIKLYNLNKQVHESLLRELKNDKKLLSHRIKAKISKKKVHIDIYKKLLGIANRHYQFVKDYAKNFNPSKRYPTSLILSVVSHKRSAEAIYKALANIKMRKTLHSVLLQKLDKVFQSLADSTADLSNRIAALARDVSSGRMRNLKEHAANIDLVISSKVNILREFAYKYSYNVIHSDHFYDLDGNKLILVTKHDHRHAAAA